MLEDGNCLFRAVADQVYGDSDEHDLVRQMCIDYMVRLSPYMLWSCLQFFPILKEYSVLWSCAILDGYLSVGHYPL